MKTIKYQSNKKERLDKFLAKNLPDISRARWQKHIKLGEILVNGKTTTSHHPLTSGDVIKIRITKKKKATEPDWKINIIKETANYLIINKPAGLVVHPTPNTKTATLIDILLKKYPEIKEVGDEPKRPGVVHRLDKDVSGLLVIARTPTMFTFLKQQFKNRKIEKIYQALVHYPLTNTLGKIDFKIERGRGGKMAARPQNQDGKEALTEYEVIQNYQHYSYLNINLKTGRTHQIRVHLNAIGHPLVGEKLYHPKKLKSNLKLDRLFLHAHRLGFTDLKNEWQEYSSPLPAELKKILTTLQ